MHERNCWRTAARLLALATLASLLASARCIWAQPPAPQRDFGQHTAAPLAQTQPLPGDGAPARLPPPDVVPAAAIQPDGGFGAGIGSYVDATLQPPADYAPQGIQPRGYQDAPGVPEYRSEYERYSEPIPEYVYDPDYYYSGYNEVHQLADYAPPGYEARDYQSAPGDPEYTPYSPPVRVTQEEREKFVVGGIMPGSFLAPGTNTSFRLRGFVRLAALYDLDPIGLRDAFPTNTIPVPQEEGQNFNMSARISRFALETWTPTDWCERTIHTFIEGDFFNGADQAVGGGGNPFRLRHAFFDVGWFRFGQQNSVFMDGTNWPSLVDFQGPNSWVNQRQPSARMTVPIAERLFWAASMERPFSNIATNGLGDQVQDVPDFATHVRFEADRGHLQVSGLVRSIGFEPTGGDVTRQTGSGISGSAVFHPWALLLGTDPVHEEYPSGLTRSRILLMATWGTGIARYVNDLAGQSLDGQVDPLTGDFDTVPVTAWNASYEHWFNESWLANATYAQVGTSSNPNQPAGTYDSGQYFAVSFWWIPVTRLSFGIEYLWGERENVDGQSAQANRIHGLFQYNF
jgi:hypothetical protein